MSITLSEKCYAKINISLDVLGRLDDGYHTVEMLMQTVSLHDILTVSVHKEPRGIHISCSGDIYGFDEVPQDSRNLAVRAAELFMQTANIVCGLDISIEKNIPVGAGLGGASSDAAGVLRVLNRHFGEPLTYLELRLIAAKLGADVPFFLCGGCMFADGIGTNLAFASPLPEKTLILIAKPPVFLSTPEVYKNLNLEDVTKHPDTHSVIHALKSHNLSTLADSCGNVLETSALRFCSEIDEYKSIMKKCGARIALMSGSGPSVFGIFTNRRSFNDAFGALRELSREVYFCYPQQGKWKGDF